MKTFRGHFDEKPRTMSLGLVVMACRDVGHHV